MVNELTVNPLLNRLREVDDGIEVKENSSTCRLTFEQIKSTVRMAIDFMESLAPVLERAGKADIALQLVLDDYTTRLNDYNAVIINPVIRSSRVKRIEEALGEEQVK